MLLTSSLSSSEEEEVEKKDKVLFETNIFNNDSYESVLNSKQNQGLANNSRTNQQQQQQKSKMNGLTTQNTNGGSGGTPGFPLRESTVNNILSHPKYGAQLKNQDAFTYLRFGLPRVKTLTTMNNGNSGDEQQQQHRRLSRNNNNNNNNTIDMIDDDQDSSGRIIKTGNRNTTMAMKSNDRSGSAAINEELKRRFWGSNSALIHPTTAATTNAALSSTSTSSSSENESDLSAKEAATVANQKNHFNNNRYNNNNNHYQHHQDRFSKPPIAKHHMTRLQTAHDISSRHSDHHLHHPHHHKDYPNNNNNNSDVEDFHIHPASRHSPFNIDDDDDLNIDAGNGGGEPTFGLNPQSSSSSTLPPPLAKHPHLVVKDLMYEVDKSSNWRRLCGFSRQKLRVLEDISFDVRGGELMAIMSTSANEGTSLLNVLGARHDYRNGTARAEIYLNGVLISTKHLSHMIGYVTKNMQLCSTMSTRQALLFAGLLMGPASRSSTDVKRLTRTLLEELNLGEVRHTKLSELTYSERRRLHVAMHLLLDTELLLIDQPLFGLDIFDSFFMIEYLRQWAMIGGRIVIMTISPPTYEVFTMIHRVLLISAGRPLFVGPRKDFLRYFNSIGYPCPSFKNPSDYYLDLVTLDDLSQEALLESSQRIENIANIHSRRSMSEIFSSMPGPPAVLPAPFRRANFAMQFLALWIRALIFSFPYNVVHLFNRFIITLLLSLIIGGIYWQIRTGREQEFVWDRIGFINTMISIGIIPILTIELINAYTEKLYIISEVHQGFYSLPAYLLAKLLYSTPQTILIGLAYALPACSMAGLQLHSNPNSLPFYLLLMLSYFIALRSFINAIVWICNRRSNALFLFGFLFTIFLLSSGINIQYRDISITHRWLRQISPIRWLHEAIVAWEFEPNTIDNLNNGGGSSSNSNTISNIIISSFLCSRNPVIQQPNAILVRADCGFQQRSNILKWFEYQGGNIFTTKPNLRPSWHAFIALFILFIGSFIIGSIIFCLRVYYFNNNNNNNDDQCPMKNHQDSTSTAAIGSSARHNHHR
ncbi:abc transporter sub-family g-like protein [Dermatophagoides farinae]|uniref:Abc transporter sub-family g-like protein n=1 Tax=Dermatophagoides farinae TaxID=6954 RepID=A0A9D4P8B9_DERFA|nr:abc transporter sub-family g-like protein [Dermatophagoides farinae]